MNIVVHANEKQFEDLSFEFEAQQVIEINKRGPNALLDMYDISGKGMVPKLKQPSRIAKVKESVETQAKGTSFLMTAAIANTI